MKKTGNNRILITCARGVPPFLQEELSRLGYPVISVEVAGVVTEGSIEDAMKINLSVRTGQRVLFLLREFGASDPAALYRGMFLMPWEDYIAQDGYVCVTSVADQPGVADTRYVNVKAKDAIVDRIRERKGKRPDSGPDRDGSVVHVYWKDDRCSVYLDTSGESLSRRGYRKIPLRAPMQEALAAAVIMATGWRGGGNFINPMCGSGTLAIEAALLATDRAPGLSRENFGFMHLRGYDGALWKAMVEEAGRRAKSGPGCRIIATDINPEAVTAARKNAAAAGVEDMIEFDVCDFADTPVPEGGGAIMLNPEYGERMGEKRELENTYGAIGDFFKRKGGGYRGYIFTGNLDLAKKVGLRTKRRLVFFNGGIECRLLEYELYEGSRK